MTKPFSIVTPIKNENQLILKTLPSLYQVNPDEVVLCFDKPVERHTLKIVKKIIKAYNADNITKIIEVERNHEWSYHQAYVRRTGFKKATYDRILTTDIDLIINKNVLKALNMVGKDKIGLVSCMQFRYPNNLVAFWRTIGYNILRKVFFYIMKTQKPSINMSIFSGLYALYRPFWRDSEDEEDVKKLISAKHLAKGSANSERTAMFIGEDRYLRDCMEKHYRVVHLEEIGAFCLSDSVRDRPVIQFEAGRWRAKHNKSFLGQIIRTVIYFHPNHFRGFIYERQIMKRGIE